jgi:threonine synthase
MTIACIDCGAPYPEVGLPYRCPVCGGIYDYTVLPRFHYEPGEPGIWGYRKCFDLPPEARMVTLGEGNTPLIAARLDGGEVWLKLEGSNPTGSYKDRGSAVLAGFLAGRGVKEAVEDSSGNAGASFAAYAARAGIRARVYVPESASGPKRRQIEAYGAEIMPIPGPRSNAAQAVRKAAEAGIAYASHVYLPQVIAGYATLAYELYAQLGQAPAAVIAPVGMGNLLIGIGRGFDQLLAAGKIARKPAIIGVQARACAPLWAAYHDGVEAEAKVTEADTLAEGVRVRRPVRGVAIFKQVSESQGDLLAVEESAILPGRDALARQGVYVEPTSALVVDAYRQLRESGRLPEGPVALALTGSGLKSQI